MHGDKRRLSEIAYSRILEGLFLRKVPLGAFVSQSELVELLDVPLQPDADRAESAVAAHFQGALQRTLGLF